MEDKKEDSKPITLLDDLTINLDGTAVFVINEEGAIQGNYRGIFILRCYLNPLDGLAAGRMMRDLLGPYGADAGDQDRYTSFCYSQLSKRVIKGPPWWSAVDGQPGNVPDLNILSIILDRALTAESAYKEDLKKRKEAALEKAILAAQALQESLNPKKKEE